MLIDSRLFWRRAIRRTLQRSVTGSRPRNMRRRRSLHRDSAVVVEKLEDRTLLSAPDPLEPNNTLAEATQLGVVVGHGTIDNVALSIHETGDEDWYNFELAAASGPGHFVGIEFDHEEGDLDLELFDHEGELVAWSAGVDDTEEINGEGLLAGEYSLRVFGYDGDSNPEYQVHYNAPTTDGDFAESNNSIETAHDFGTLEGFHLWQDLSIHESGNDDWYVFDLAEDAEWVHFAAIMFNHDQGDLDLVLYDADGDEVDDSAGTHDFEMIWLEGLEAGTYYLEVYGFAGDENPDYTMVIEAPHATDHVSGTFDPDEKEPNDSIETAWDLGQVTGFQEIGPLSIHEPGDEDWFHFETTAAATSWDGAAIDFWHEEGDIDLALFDAQGEMIANTGGINDLEYISMEGLPEGEYYLRVNGFEDATNPDYWLTLNAPEPIESDFAESNDTFQDAYNLRDVAGIETIDGLSIHVGGDVDWFRFEMLETATDWHSVSIAFFHEAGDLDLALYNPEGELIESSEGVDGFEQVHLDGLPAGEYYASVWGFEDDTNPEYLLTIIAPEESDSTGGGTADFAEPNNSSETAYDLRVIENDSFWDNLSIHEPTDEDWFTFTTLAPGAITDGIGIEFDHELGDLDLSLFDAEGNLLETSESIWDFEHISLEGLPAGTYQIQVTGFDGAVHPEYVLGITAPKPLEPDFAEENNSQQTAFELRDANGFSIWHDFSIHDETDVDWFAFDLVADANASHAVGVEFFHAAGDLDISLYDASGELISDSSGIDDGEEISLHGLEQGTYHLEVTGYDGATVPHYAIWIEAPHEHHGGEENEFEPDWSEVNNSLAQATSLREIVGHTTWDGLSIHDEADVDWFAFELLAEGTTHHHVAIDFDHLEGDLDLSLFDSQGTLLGESTGVSDFEEISLSGWPAGEYHLQIYGYQGATNPEYALMIDGPDWNENEFEGNFPPDTHEPNDSQEEAFDLRTIEGHVHLQNLSIHSQDDVDWFEFTITATATEGHWVEIDFEHELGDLDMALYNDDGLIDTSDSVDDFEAISLQGLVPDTYWIEIFEYSGETNPEYNLSIEAPLDRDPDPDRFEENDTLTTATAVRSDAATGTLTGDVSLEGLSVHSDNDVDLFAFTTIADGTSAHRITIAYRHGDGDLVLDVLDSEGLQVATTTGDNGYADVSLDGLAADTWYARVTGFEGDTNYYDIEFDAPRLENPENPGGGEGDSDAWTVMVYITASNLESFAHSDINEMEIAVASLPGSVNLSVLWDQSAAGATFATGGGSQSAWGDAGRAFISPDSNPTVIATEFELLGELNTGDPQTLADFIDWSVDQAPAEHYALVMWDHGSGLQGFNYDDLDGTASDHLTTPELVDVLAAPQRPHLDVLAFDACLMAMAEVGFSLAEHTGVFVASQEVVGANGHDYTTLFEVLEQDPETIGAEALATGFVDSYQDQYEGDFWGWDTHSAISTDGYSLLLETLGDFVDVGLAGNGDDIDVLRDARDDAIPYDIAFLRDLGSFVGPVADSDDASAALREAAVAVEDAIDAMTLARSDDKRDSSGISIFLPDNATTAGSWYTTPYSSFDESTGWSSLIDTMGGNGRSNAGNSGGRSITGPDWSEQNDVAAAAHDLNSLVGNGHVFSSLNLHTNDDSDWFRLTITSEGSSSDKITVTPSGDATESIRLELYDSTGTTPLQTASNGPGPQQVSLDGLAAGTYLVHVDSPSAIAVAGYDLMVDAPDGDAASDWAGDNSTLPKAFHLGTIGSNSVFSGLGVSAGANDWFTFDTPRRANSALYTLALSTPQGQPVNVVIQDAQGGLVDQASGDGTLDLSYVASGGGEQLTLRVTGGATTSAYSLHFTPQTATIAVDLDLNGNLVVTDTTADGQDDVMLIGTVGDTIVIEAPGHVLSATVGSSLDPHRVEVPVSDITGEIRVVAGAGDDRIDASGSLHPVRLLGASGRDTLTGGFAADILNGGGDDDILSAGDGNDRLFGGGGHDVLAGGSDNDYLSGQGGEDTMHGDTGHDTINGGAANDKLFGDSGDDRLNGNDGHDQINGSGGNDTAYGGNGNDVLRGGSGRDWLSGGAGGDRQFGQGSTDTLHGGGSNDLLNGGPGSDQVYEIGNIDFTLLSTQLTGQGIDTLIDIERGRIEGGVGDNVIDASQFPGTVALFGGPGNDRLVGGAAIDRLVGQDGNDTLEGLAGNDRIFGGRGLDHLDGGHGDDFLRGQSGADSIVGGPGRDTLNGEAGDDSLQGGDGDDVIRGGSGNDHATGNAGSDRVYGQSGDDALCSEDDDLLVDNVDQIDRCAVIFTDWADQLN